MEGVRGDEEGLQRTETGTAEYRRRCEPSRFGELGRHARSVLRWGGPGRRRARSKQTVDEKGCSECSEEGEGCTGPGGSSNHKQYLYQSSNEKSRKCDYTGNVLEYRDSSPPTTAAQMQPPFLPIRPLFAPFSRWQNRNRRKASRRIYRARSTSRRWARKSRLKPPNRRKWTRRSRR